MVSCGTPLPGHDVRILDEAGRSLPDRHIGEIVLSGPSVTPGYYNDVDATARAIRDGRLFTGDLGYLSSGELFVCGRVNCVRLVVRIVKVELRRAARVKRRDEKPLRSGPHIWRRGRHARNRRR